MKRGSPADLLVFADSFNRANGFGALAKSERGYAVGDGDEPSSFKAGPIELKPDMPAAEAFQAIARACIRHFGLNEPLLIARRSAESLHQSRVAMRRLRSALSLFKPIATDKKYERFKRGLSDIFHKLGDARDLDVYCARIALANVGEHEGLPPFTLDPGERVQAERERAYQSAISALQSKRLRQFIQKLVAWIDAGPWCTSNEPQRQAVRDQAIEDFAGQVLDRLWRKLKRGGHHLEQLSPEEVHRIRIDAKKLRYGSEFFSSLVTDRKGRKRLKSFIATLEFLQARLGDLNDIQTQHEIAAKLARPESAAARVSEAAGAAAHRNEENKRTAALLRSASKAYRHLLDGEPFWKG
ncbi:MAG: CHAD domain-containing protein [Pseudomonadota bacterium]